MDFLKSLTREEIELVHWLEKCTPLGRWEIGKDGLVNVFGSFDCSGQDLKDFKGVKFGIVTENFCCENNKLRSLEGAPKEVGENFDCSFNKLTSLKGLEVISIVRKTSLQVLKEHRWRLAITVGFIVRVTSSQVLKEYHKGLII